MKPKPGYILFTSSAGLFSIGIKWFNRRGAGSVKVNHAGLVALNGKTVEAHMPQGIHQNVFREMVEEAIADPKRKIFLAVPKGWTRERGVLMATRATEDIGMGYDVASIGAFAISQSIIGHTLSRLTGGWFERKIGNAMNAKDKFFCSEHVAKICYEALPEFEEAVIRQDPHFIPPQELFDNTEMWDKPPVEITSLKQIT